MNYSNRKHTFDETFFDKIDTEEKAYTLGVLYSDGNNLQHPTSGGFTITQLERDRDILEKIKISIKSTYPLKEETQKTNGKTRFTLYVYDKSISKKLENVGVFKNKSLILKFPTFISDDLMPHFIRGYFDGDGSIWEGKRKKMVVKNERKPDAKRERIVHNVKFNFTGSETFIPDLQNYLIEHCGFTKTKLNYSKSKIEHKHCTLEYSGRKNVFKLYEYMYSNATIFGERKKKKFENIICALSEKSLSEMGLIAGNTLEP